MSSHEVRFPAQPEAQPVLEVSEYCRRTGTSEAEERRLITLLGRFASRHEIEMNIVGWPLRIR
jgi:hypothetical protein